MLGKEVKMGPVDLPPEAWEAMDILKRGVQTVPVLIFLDFDKPFLLKTDASKEGLGAVLSQKDVIILSPLVAAPLRSSRRIITAPSWSSWC